MRAQLFNIDAYHKYKNVIDGKNNGGMWWNFTMFESIVVLAQIVKISVARENFSPVFFIYAAAVLLTMLAWVFLKKKYSKATNLGIVVSYLIGFAFAAHMEIMFPDSHIVLLNFGVVSVDLAASFIVSPYLTTIGQVLGTAAFIGCYMSVTAGASPVVVGYAILICALSIAIGMLIWNLRISNVIFENELAYLSTGTDDIFTVERNKTGWKNQENELFSGFNGKRRSFTFVFNVSEDRLISVRDGNIFELKPEMNWDEISTRLLRYVGDPSSYRQIEKLLQASDRKGLSKEETRRTVAAFNMPNGERKWFGIELSVRPHPVKGAIMKIVTMEDITGTKLRQGIMDLMLRENYDSVICFEKMKKHGTMIASDDNGNITVTECDDYENMMVNYATEWVADYDRERAIKEGHLKNLYDNLQEDGIFEIFLDECIDNNEIRKKKFTASYLDADKRFLAIFKQDVTAIVNREKDAKEQLTKALEEAKAANAVKTEFLSRMSHEMRTPMNAIMGLASLVEDASGNPEQLKDYVSKIKSSSDYLLQLINDVLDMSGISEGRLTITNSPVKFSEFNETINTIIEPLCQNKNIAYFTTTEIPDNAVILMDKLRVSQIFTNLLGNAVKYTSEGGIIEFSSYCIGIDGNRGSYRFVVKDNGIGMTEEFAQHMFEPFSQEKETNRASLNGTGIGLSIAKGIVDMMGGKISATSKPDVGTTFVVDLTLEVANKEEKEPEKKEISLDCLKNKRILVVEDNEINREIAVALLEGQEMITDEVVNGLEAVETFDKSTERYYDAILMDIRMPKMNGLEATRKIRELQRKDSQNVPIIAMTANAFSEDVELSVNSGMNAHLSKPINPQILYETLAKFILERK